MTTVDVLLPTFNRLESLVMTMSGLATQNHRALRVIVSDQSDTPVESNPVVRMLTRAIEARGGSVEWHHRLPLHGIAEQRNFLLEQATAPAVLFLDDDVLMESWVVGRMLEVLEREECGFVGAFPAGLQWVDDVRPHQQAIEYWEGRVEPEAVTPGRVEWERRQLHRAANLFHVTRGMTFEEARVYKVAWVASCVIYDRSKLSEIGGFGFWDRLPRYHSGEEVLVQNLLMRRWGGCAIAPSGTYYSDVSSTVLNEEGRVDGHALELLPEMIGRYAPGTSVPLPEEIQACK